MVLWTYQAFRDLVSIMGVVLQTTRTKSYFSKDVEHVIHTGNFLVVGLLLLTIFIVERIEIVSTTSILLL